MSNPLMVVRDLVVEYPSKGWRSPAFRALHGVSLEIGAGETLGLVGESGSGKTTIGRAILGLAPVTSGAIEFDGRDISHATRLDRRLISRELQVVFQDPYSSLNPSMTVGNLMAEPLRVQGASRAAVNRRIADLLDKVGLPRGAAERLPREFSGGQRQRVAIARALALDPRVIVCDEPVSALDLTTQARILDLLVQLQEETGVSYLFISHDLEVVRHVSHRVAVLFQGRIVESGDAEKVTGSPEQPYTRQLLLASPVTDPDRQAERRRQRQSLPAGPLQ